MTTAVDNVLDAARRVKIVQGWKARLDRLDISNRQFCLRHKLRPESLCRNLGGKKTARWPTIEKVEKALRTEEKRLKKIWKK